MIASETRETPSLRPGFLAAFLCVLTLAALSGTEAGAVGRGALESAVAQYLRVEQLPLANPTDGQVLGYDSATKRAVWQDSSATIGGSLGATDNVLLRSDGTGGVTAQGSDATMDDSELLDLGSTGILAVSGGTASAVGIQVARDANTGIYGTADTSISAAIGGAEYLRIVTSGVGAYNGGAGAITALLAGGTTDGYGGLRLHAGLGVNWASGADATSSTDDLGIDRDAAGRALVHNGDGATAADLRLAQAYFGTADGSGILVRANSGSLQFLDGDGTSFSAGEGLQVGTCTIASGGTITAGAGSASNGAYQFNSDPDTCLYGVANASIGMAIGGTQIAAVGTTGLTARLYPEAVTGNYTLANTQSMQVLTNTGAGGAVEIELGSITATGFAITVVATDNQDITLDPGASDKFVGLAGGWADGEAMLVDDQNDAVRLVRLSTGDWLVEWTRGTLTEETP